jgi:monoamine oxidase
MPEFRRPVSASKSVSVIGSGFGGLATAIRLQTRGYQVDLFEARDKLGGRAYLYEQDGFKFDGGPTVITAPFLLSLLPWYRSPRVLLAPFAIYLFQHVALNGMLTTLSRRPTLWKNRHV